MSRVNKVFKVVLSITKGTDGFPSLLILHLSSSEPRALPKEPFRTGHVWKGCGAAVPRGGGSPVLSLSL